MMINVFFKEIKVIGQENIPIDATVVFCGNHANQYIDPCMILAYCKQQISFLVASKAMRTPIVSQIARKMKCIAVERPQDLAKRGTGKLTVQSETVIKGVNTQFKKEVMVGDTIKFEGSTILEQLVDKIVSDTELVVKAPGIDFYEQDKEYSFKVIPKLDQTHVYEAVISRLSQGQSIGIFPEGGSHDRTDMLPIKAGVSIMALGAMARDPNAKICIIACGLKYFKPQKFRSQVIVEFSRPYYITKELTETYKKNKRQACGQMLVEVEKKMRDVTLSAPSYKELRQIYMARDLYMPRKNTYTPEQINEIYKNFFKGFNSFRSHPELKQLLEDVDDYMRELKTFKVQDSEVKTIQINFFKILSNFLITIPKFLINLLFSLAGLIMLLPLGMLNSHLAEKARKEALAGSTVKIVGVDVMATKKLSTTIMLYPLLCFGFSAFFYYVLGKFELEPCCKYPALLAFFILFPLYSYICILSRDRMVKYYHQMQARLLCLFYTQEMFILKQMRKTLKKRIIGIVDKLGPEMLQDFDKIRTVKRGQNKKKGAETASDQSTRKQNYEHELELNNVFGSLHEVRF